MIADIRSNIELITPPRDLLGTKKRPACTEKLWKWLCDTAVDADKLIVSSRLQSRVHMYPGADEVGCTLLAHRNLREFVARINAYIKDGCQVAVADVAFCNGGDHELVLMLIGK